VSLLVVQDARVFDGVSDRPIARASVVVAGGRVREVALGPVSPPRGARVVDGRSHTLLPGLIDMHSHLLSEEGVRLYLASGVTAVRLAGNDLEQVAALRRRIAGGAVAGPRLFSLGPLLDGVSPDYPAMSWPLASAAAARGAVRRLAREHRVDGIILTQKPAREVAEAAVAEAHRLGLGVTGQTWSLSAREAVRLGFDGLENTSRLPEAPDEAGEARLLAYRTIAERAAMLGRLWARADPARLGRLGHLMAERGVYLVPTLAGMDAITGRYTARIRADRDTWRLSAGARRTLLGALGRPFFAAGWTPADLVAWRRGIRRYERFVRDYARLGGRVLPGTDCLQPCPGFLFHEELRRLARAGLPVAAVLRAATAAAASTLGRPDLGRIAPGATADLLLVAGDPFARLGALRDVRLVVVGGRVVSPDGLADAPLRP
jgi:imidazolonepropionase-like amidohydrolase